MLYEIMQSLKEKNHYSEDRYKGTISDKTILEFWATKIVDSIPRVHSDFMTMC